MLNGFGRLLREYREEARFKLLDLAEKMNWSVVYLSDIERGRRNPPSPAKIKEIASFLNKDAKPLLDMADQEKGKIELDLVDKSPEIMQTGIMLARTWDYLDEETAKKIMKILRKED